METLPPPAPDQPAGPPAIWAIGGGKGGVGKSVIAANLAAALAATGRRTALVDADLGGANLHTLLGVPSPQRGLADFIARRAETLDEVMVPTPVDHLWLLSGARALLEAANPHHSQKEKILRHLVMMPADVVVIDLGAGSAFNVLDFFLVADRGVLVLVPEATSVENGYHFLKAAFYRRLKRAQPRDRVREAIGRVTAERHQRGIRSPKDLIAHVAEVDAEAGAAMAREAERFRPGILVNRCEIPEHRRLGDDVGVACRDYFGTEIVAMGTLPRDPLVGVSVQRRQLAATLFPESMFMRGIRELAAVLTG